MKFRQLSCNSHFIKWDIGLRYGRTLKTLSNWVF